MKSMLRRQLAFQFSILLVALSPVLAPAQDSAADEDVVFQGTLLAPKAFRAAVAKVRPAVVRIETFGGVDPATGGRVRGLGKPGEGPTTGVILSEDGYIVTSTFNFLRQPPTITVVLSSGQRHVAKLLGRDEARKICLLKIDADEPLPTAMLAPREKLRVGAWAVTAGLGYGGKEPAVSAGIISATRRASGRAVQTDANTSPANYGGPLLDIEGRVIGICVPLHPRSKKTEAGAQWYDSGIGFAVPLDDIPHLIEAMKKGRMLKPGRLGVAVDEPSEDKPGVPINSVQSGLAAAKAGLKPEDRVVQVDGRPVTSAYHLKTLLARHAAGDQVQIVVDRVGMQVAVTATLGEEPVARANLRKLIPRIRPK